MTTTDQATVPVAPEDVARAVVLPASYADLDGTVFPACDWLRKNAPVALAKVEGYDPVWLVAKHADCDAVMKDAELFHIADHNIMLQPQLADQWLREVLGGHTRVIDDLSYTEPPTHTAHRGAIARDFLPAQVRKFMPRFRELAKEAVDRMFDEHPDGECDFVGTLSMKYPLNAVLQMLGVPPGDYMYMLKLTQDTFGGDDPDWRRDDVPAGPEAMAMGWKKAVDEAYEYFEVIRQDRHANPRDDIATSIVTARLANGEFMPEKVQNDLTIAIALAGHDTTNSALSGGLHGLAVFPEQFEKVRADLKLVPGLVEESLRWSTPAKHFMRNATADTEVGGVPIANDDRLMLLFVSSNRDADVFERPYEFDVTRRPNPQHSFGGGVHVCLGQNIAKIEMRALFEELLPRLKSVELAGEPKLKISNFVSGFKTLPIRFTKA